MLGNKKSRRAGTPKGIPPRRLTRYRAPPNWVALYIVIRKIYRALICHPRKSHEGGISDLIIRCQLQSTSPHWGAHSLLGSWWNADEGCDSHFPHYLAHREPDCLQ